MSKLKIALVVVDRENVPEWVFPEMEKLDVEFVAKNCESMDDFLQCASDAFLIWTMGVCKFITPEILPELSCKYIMRSGSGLDTLPVKKAAELGITVTNTPESIANSVAEHAVSLLFALSRQIVNYDRRVRTGEWGLKKAWDSWHMNGQTLGLIGFGFIARKVAKFMSGFDLKIFCFDPYQKEEFFRANNVIPVDMDTLLRESDFISVHCPLTDSTFHLFGEAEFRKMKKSALIVNTSRGAVIDEEALFNALKNKLISGAALDVTETEPLAKNSPLLKLENLIITPHVAAWDDVFDENYWRGSVSKIQEILKERI